MKFSQFILESGRKASGISGYHGLTRLTPKVKVKSFLTFDPVDRTMKMISFIGKLLSSTLLWCCLFFNFTQFLILEKLSILNLAEVKRLLRSCTCSVKMKRQGYA